MSLFSSYCAVAIGGAVGASARFALVTAATRLLPWPWWTATLLVNVLGGFIAGIALVWLQTHAELAWVRPLLMVGFLGGLTTFSAFTVELVQLLQQARYVEALLAMLLSVVLCVLACMAGMFLAKLF